MLVAIAQDLAHFLRRAREQNGERHATIGGQRVGFVGAAALGVGDQRGLRHELPQILDNLVTPREYRLVRLWKFNQGHTALPSTDGASTLTRKDSLSHAFDCRAI